MFKVNLHFACTLYLYGFLHQVVLAEKPFCQVTNRRNGGLGVKLVGLLRQLQVVRELRAEVYLLHHALPNHTVKASPVQKESPHVNGTVAIVRRAEPCPGEDNHVAVLGCRNGKRCREYRFSPNLGVVHISVRNDRTLICRLLHESRQYLDAVQAAVAVAQHASYLFPDRPHENTASLRPAAMLVKKRRSELLRPRLARSKPTQVSLRYAHTVGELPYGVVVEGKLSVRHIHTERAVCAERDNRAVVVDFQVHAYRGDVVLCNLALVHEAFHCCPYSDGFAVNHSLNFVHHYFVQTLL